MAGRWRQSTIQIVMSAMPAVIYWVTGLTGHGDHMAISIGTLVAFTTPCSSPCSGPPSSC